MYARELADSLLHLLPWIREVFQPAGQEVFVGLQVEVPMAAQVKEDHPWTAVALGLKRFVGGFADRMRRLRRRDNPLCPCKLQGGFKHRPLLIRYGLDVLVVIEQTHQGRVPVVAQPSGVNGRRDKTVPQRVHFQQRRGGRRVAEVIQIHAAGQRRACFGLDGDDANLLALELVRQEGERQPGHVAPPADAPDHHVRILTGQLHLPAGLQADDGLMQEDVIQHAAQRVLRIVVRGGIFHRLADRDAQAPRGVRILGQDRAAGVGPRAGAGNDLGAPGLHHDLAVRLLVMADLDHVHGALQIEQAAGQGQGASPLPGACLGRQPAHAGLLVVEGLRHSGIRLVASGGTRTFIFVVDVRGRIQHPFQPPGPVQRRRPPQPVDVSHRLRNRDLALGADFLQDEVHRK